MTDIIFVRRNLALEYRLIERLSRSDWSISIILCWVTRRVGTCVNIPILTLLTYLIWKKTLPKSIVLQSKKRAICNLMLQQSSYHRYQLFCFQIKHDDPRKSSVIWVTIAKGNFFVVTIVNFSPQTKRLKSIWTFLSFVSSLVSLLMDPVTWSTFVSLSLNLGKPNFATKAYNEKPHFVGF